MTPDEKLDWLIRRQAKQFDYLEGRLNLIESRVFAMQHVVLAHLKQPPPSPLSIEELEQEMEAARARFAASVSEYPSCLTDMPDGVDEGNGP